MNANVTRSTGEVRPAKADRTKWVLVVPMLAAFSVRLAWVLAFQTRPGPDAASYDALGSRLVFYGQGRFHMQVVPVIVVLSIHLFPNIPFTFRGTPGSKRLSGSHQERQLPSEVA